MQSMKSATTQRNLENELANRVHNLSVIEETIQKNPKSSSQLLEVRDLLTRRITELNSQLANFHRSN